MLKRLHALWILGSAMFLVILRRAFVRGRPLDRFAEYYGGEGIVAFTDDESRVLRLASRCTGCGKCDVDGSGRIVLFALAGTRSLADADASVALLRVYDSSALSEAERRCPEDVPLAAFATLVRAHAPRLQNPHRG